MGSGVINTQLLNIITTKHLLFNTSQLSVMDQVSFSQFRKSAHKKLYFLIETEIGYSKVPWCCKSFQWLENILKCLNYKFNKPGLVLGCSESCECFILVCLIYDLVVTYRHCLWKVIQTVGHLPILSCFNRWKGRLYWQTDQQIDRHLCSFYFWYRHPLNICKFKVSLVNVTNGVIC